MIVCDSPSASVGIPKVENSALSQLESLSQHIPKEILLSKDNVQLSNVIGEGSNDRKLGYWV